MRKFTDDERERIREGLVRNGRELLVRYGPKKTTVQDITEPVGIAKPTFYQFFDAKSDLYVEIFEREFDEYVETLQSELDGVDDTRERLERFFRCYVEFGEENEFIQQVFLRGDYRDVMGDLSSEQVESIERKEMKALLPPIEAVQEQSDGPISEMEPITVVGIMGSSLGLQVLHKDEFEQYTGEIDAIGDGIYQHLQDVLISTLARGLTTAE